MVCLIIYSIKQIEMYILLSILIHESVCSTAHLTTDNYTKSKVNYFFIHFVFKPDIFLTSNYPTVDGNPIVESSHFFNLFFTDIFFQLTFSDCFVKTNFLTYFYSARYISVKQNLKIENIMKGAQNKFH